MYFLLGFFLLVDALEQQAWVVSREPWPFSMLASKAIKAWFAVLIVCAFSTMHGGNCHGKRQSCNSHEYMQLGSHGREVEIVSQFV